MKVRNLLRTSVVAFGTLVAIVGFAASARAGCGDVTWNAAALNAALNMASHASPALLPDTSATALLPDRTATLLSVSAHQAQPEGASIVGMWSFQFVTKNSPPIPDGTVIDAGYAQWHSDGTEITNSSRPPASGNFCLGVWKKTGPSTYKLNHRGLSWDPITQTFIGPAIIQEEVTVDHGGDSFSGKFTIDQFQNDVLIAHIEGEVTGVRFSVD
jgi:hypothetical protein